MCLNKITSLFLFIITAVYFWGCDLKFQDSASQVFNELPIQLTTSTRLKSDPAWSPDGSKIAFSSLIRTTQMSRFSLEGKGTISFFEIEDDSIDSNFTFSPDGRQVCYRSLNRGHLWIYDFDANTETLLTPSIAEAQHPDWSGSSRFQIAFSGSINGDNYDIWMISPDDSSERRLGRVTESESNSFHPSWSPDGNKIVYEAATDSSGSIMIVDFLESNLSTRIDSVDTLRNHDPDWSPDDSTIIYHSTRGDTTAIWAFSLNDFTETKITKNTLDATRPAWSPDGTRIAYKTPDGLSTASPTGESVSLTPLSEPYPVWVPGQNSLATRTITENSIIEVFSLENASTTEVTAVSKYFNDYEPAWFPDNKTITFVRHFEDAAEFGETLWLVEYSSGLAQPLFEESIIETSVNNPAISPDGSLLVFDDGDRIFLTLTADKTTLDLSPFVGFDVREPSWSPAGNGFICHSRNRLKIFKTDSSLVVEARQLPFNLRNPVWSNAHSVFGESIAAESNSGIVILAAEDPTSARTVVRGGTGPTWSPDGSKIAYERNGQIYELTILMILPE